VGYETHHLLPVNATGCTDRYSICSCDVFKGLTMLAIHGEVPLTTEEVVDDWQKNHEN